MNAHGNTPLHVACLTENVNVMEAFIKLKANVNLYNHLGETPLYIAIVSENLRMVKILVDNNANCEYLDWEIRQTEQIPAEIHDYLYDHGISVTNKLNHEIIKNIDYTRIHHKIERLITQAETIKSNLDSKIIPLPIKEINMPKRVLLLERNDNDDIIIERDWKDVYSFCCSFRGVEYGKLDRRGVFLMFEHLKIPITQSELQILCSEFTSDFFTLEQISSIFGSSWSFFQGEVSLPKSNQSKNDQQVLYDPQNVNKRFSLPKSPRTDSLSEFVLNNSLNMYNDITSTDEIAFSCVAKSNDLRALPSSEFQLSKSIEDDSSEMSSEESKSARKRVSYFASKSNPLSKSFDGKSKGLAKEKKSRIVIRTPKTRSKTKRSSTDTRRSSRGKSLVENELQNIISGSIINNKLFSRDDSDEKLSSLVLYSNLYRKILRTEAAAVLTPELLIKYFKHCSCEESLLKTIIPAIIQQSTK